MFEWTFKDISLYLTFFSWIFLSQATVAEVEDKTSNDDVGVTVVDPDETIPEYEGFTIDEKELENAEGGAGIDFDRLELPSSPLVSTCASIRRNASLQFFFPFITCLICFRFFYLFLVIFPLDLVIYFIRLSSDSIWNLTLFQKHV